MSLSIERFTSETLAEEVVRARLAGGLPVYFCPKPGFKKKYACYSTFYGSVDSRFRPAGQEQVITVPDGIAHFLEHTLFETEKGNVSDLFAENGAYNNAATSFATTTYLFASGERFFDNLELLVDFVENPVFDPVKIDKERGIIEQEIQKYQDEPGWVSYMGLLESLFREHPLRIDIAGSVESIREIDAQTLHDCYRTFYSPENMALFITGDLSQDEVLEFVDRHSRYGSERFRGTPRVEPIERDYPDEPDAVHAEVFERRMSVALPRIIIGFKEPGVPLSGTALLERDLLTEFALDLLLGRSSDHYLDLYSSQLILDDFSASWMTCAGVGVAMIGGETPHPERLVEALDSILERASRLELSSADFQRAKKKYMGGMVRAFNSLEYIASNYTHYRFYGLDLFSLLDAIQAVDQDAVQERLSTLFHPNRRAVSRILPVE